MRVCVHDSGKTDNSKLRFARKVHLDVLSTSSLNEKIEPVKPEQKVQNGYFPVRTHHQGFRSLWWASTASFVKWKMPVLLCGLCATEDEKDKAKKNKKIVLARSTPLSPG